MYLIINKTKGIISISDLGIVLNRRQMLDLDKVKTLIPPEKSKDLMACVRNGGIHVKHDRNTVKPEPSGPVVNHDDMIADLKDSMKEEIRKQFERLKINGDVKSSTSTSELQQIMEMMKQLMQGQQNVENSKSVSNDFPDNISDDVMADMHARAMKKMTENVDSKLNTEKNKIDDNEILNRIDDLENLI